jgi:sec-independent protein translocase protein TatA
VVGDILQPTHLLFVLIVALLVLGPKRLPEVARHLGSGIRDFKAAINGEQTGPPDDVDVSHRVAPASEAPDGLQTDAIATVPEQPPASTVTVAPQPEPPYATPVGAAQGPEQSHSSTATVLSEPEQPQTSTVAVAQQPEPSHTNSVAAPAASETEQTGGFLAEPEHEPPPQDTAQHATAPLAAPEQPPAPAPDTAEPATTELSRERPA